MVGRVTIGAVGMIETTREPLVRGWTYVHPVAEVIPSADHLGCASALDTDANLGPEA